MRNTNHHLPQFARRYFWDVDINQINVEKYSTYVIERLLEWGNPKAARWLLKRYSTRRIVSVLKQTRALSRQSANFWAVYFGVQRNEIQCLSKRYQKQSARAWPY
jgi:uncharacterized protein DUF6922